MFGAKKKTTENLHKFDRGKGKSAVGIIIAIAVLVILVSGSYYSFYCSPLGRAQKTASYTLERVGREAITHDWMKEFFFQDPVHSDCQ
mgnify:CR=1 FL=1